MIYPPCKLSKDKRVEKGFEVVCRSRLWFSRRCSHLLPY
jgi:hypothetical protein